MRLELGVVTRPHGLDGEVIVRPTSNVAQRFSEGAVFEVENRALHPDAPPQLPVAEISQLRLAQARGHEGRLICAFEGIVDKVSAEKLRGVVLYGAPLEYEPPNSAWAHKVIGRQVVDHQEGPLGVVRAVEVNPAHDLLVLDSGLLVPSVFASNLQEPDVAIEVELPAGFLEAVKPEPETPPE